MMKIVISGGGMVGMALARLLRMRGIEPVVLERMPAGAYVPRGYMLGYHGFMPLEEIGVLKGIRDQGWDIAPRDDGSAVAICVEVGKVLNALAEDLPVVNEHVVSELVKDDSGRVVGVVAQGPDGPTTFEADLVIACDGVNSPVREMAGLESHRNELADAALSFMTPTVTDKSFAMAYMSDGGHIGMLGWPQGSAGWRSCEKVGAEAALAPGVEAIKKMWTELLPESAEAAAGITSIDQVRYSEPSLLTSPEWWTPGVVIIGDAAHFFGPESGVSSGLGLGDAHALAEAIRQNPGDPDAACQSYVIWRGPVIRPFEATDPGLQRKMGYENRNPKPQEVWPPNALA